MGRVRTKSAHSPAASNQEPQSSFLSLCNSSSPQWYHLRLIFFNVYFKENNPCFGYFKNELFFYSFLLLRSHCFLPDSFSPPWRISFSRSFMKRLWLESFPESWMLTKWILNHMWTIIIWLLSQSALAAITNYHRVDGSKNRNLLSTVPGVGSPRSGVSRIGFLVRCLFLVYR